MNFKTAKETFLAEIGYEHDLPYRERRYLVQQDADPRVFNDVDTMIEAMKISVLYAKHATQEVQENKEFRLNYLALQYPPLQSVPHDYDSPEYKEFNDDLLTLWSQVPNTEYRAAAKELVEQTLTRDKVFEPDLEADNDLER